MKRAFYDERPTTFESVGNGSYRYRWDIQEHTQEQEGQESHKGYSCFEVIVYGPVTRTKVKQIVIDELWGSGVEEKLINDYNAVQLGILDESYKQSYIDFLSDRKKIKEMIDEDLTKFNIPD